MKIINTILALLVYSILGLGQSTYDTLSLCCGPTPTTLECCPDNPDNLIFESVITNFQIGGTIVNGVFTLEVGLTYTNFITSTITVYDHVSNTIVHSSNLGSTNVILPGGIYRVEHYIIDEYGLEHYEIHYIWYYEDLDAFESETFEIINGEGCDILWGAFDIPAGNEEIIEVNGASYNGLNQVNAPAILGANYAIGQKITTIIFDGVSYDLVGTYKKSINVAGCM